MTLRDFVDEENLGKEISVPDISMAFRSLMGYRKFLPRPGEKFTIRRGKEGIPHPFPAVGVLLLYSLISNLTEGRLLVSVPRYTELTLDEAAKIFKLSLQEIASLLEQGVIPYHEIHNEKRVVLNDLKEYQNQQNHDSATISLNSEDMMAAYKAHPNLASLIVKDESPSDYAVDIEGEESTLQFFVINREGKPDALQVSKAIVKKAIGILATMTLARTVISVPLKYELSLAEAGFLLNATNTSYTAELLDQGAIPFHTVGKDRCINLADLLAYKKIQLKKSYEAIDRMASQGEDCSEDEPME